MFFYFILESSIRFSLWNIKFGVLPIDKNSPCGHCWLAKAAARFATKHELCKLHQDGGCYTKFVAPNPKSHAFCGTSFFGSQVATWLWGKKSTNSLTVWGPRHKMEWPCTPQQGDVQFNWIWIYSMGQEAKYIITRGKVQWSRKAPLGPSGLWDKSSCTHVTLLGVDGHKHLLLSNLSTVGT